ncbi:hypothetical protein ACLHZ0_20310 [Aeromonas salmonicida]|uniref:hypothetical protein n=1 Tax=Aeromonas salmonicida TaxID=645 RepID=UPI003D00CA54
MLRKDAEKAVNAARIALIVSSISNVQCRYIPPAGTLVGGDGERYLSPMSLMVDGACDILEKTHQHFMLPTDKGRFDFVERVLFYFPGSIGVFVLRDNEYPTTAGDIYAFYEGHMFKLNLQSVSDTRTEANKVVVRNYFRNYSVMPSKWKVREGSVSPDNLFPLIEQVVQFEEDLSDDMFVDEVPNYDCLICDGSRWF